MKTVKIVLQASAAALCIICLSWLGEVFRAASFLPWYKLMGTGALCLVVAGIAILSFIEDRKKAEKEKHHITIEISFERGGDVDQYFHRSGLKYSCDMENFVLRAVVAAIQKENKKGRE